MSRFPHIASDQGGRFANLGERLHAPLPDESIIAASRDSFSSRLADYRATHGNGPSKRLAAYRAATGADDQIRRDPAFRTPTTPAAKPAAKVAASPAKASAASEWDFNGWLRDQSLRASSVMSSDEAKGMEREARILLDKTNRSAAEIKAFLKDEKAAKARPGQRPKRDAEAQAKIDAVWDKANAKLATQRGTPPQTEAKAHTARPDGNKPDERSAGDVWDRVNAKSNERLVAENPKFRSLIENQQVEPAPTGDAVQDLWARAYAKIGRRA